MAQTTWTGSCAQWIGAVGSDTLRRAGKLRMVRAAAVAQESEDTRDMSFTFAVIALSAKLAAASGKAHETFLVFREVFPMPASEHAKIERLFTMAKEEAVDAAHYAEQVAELFPKSPLLQDVLQRLVKVAHAGGELSDAQNRLLRQIAREFGISRFALGRMLKSYTVSGGVDPYKVLGAKPHWPDAKIKKRYRLLVREHHPDLVRAQGGSEDAVLVAGRQVAALNAAYTALCKRRHSV